MPCYPFQIGESKGFICARGRRQAAPCIYCGKPSTQLCDYPGGRHKNGKKKDCDRAMCAKCTQKGVSVEVDFCREHYPLALAAYERRTKQIAPPKRQLTHTEIYLAFRSTDCRCSAKKWENSAFCQGCYDDLSADAKKALYRKFGDGFETAYREACRELDGDEDERS